MRWRIQIINSLKHIKTSLVKCYNLAVRADVEWLKKEVRELLLKVEELITKVSKSE